MRVRAQWDESVTLAETLCILRDLSLRHAHQGGREGAKIASAISSGDYRSLCDWDLAYDGSLSVSELIECRQALGFYQKLEPLEIGIDKEAAAYSKFLESEAMCSRTNELFGSFLAGGLSFRPADVVVLYDARRKISRILGPAPRVEELGFRFGPGATTNVKRSEACATTKMARAPACSFELLASGLLSQALRQVPHWADQHTTSYSVDDDGYLVGHVSVEVTPGRLQFVPKSAKTYRSIVVEPSLSGGFQLGIGDYMTRRLLQHGIDTTDQTLNQRLAREGSLTGELATLDLSSASDTVSKQLVRFLLPPDWFSLLSAFRSGSVTFAGNVLNLEKFSSMGNGFTFPLETLIFWALARSAAPEGVVSAYGDDLIVPARFCERVISVLTLCGFVVNSKKSFWSGPFRESCGHDYYLGIDIRPYYQKHLVSAETLFVLHNHYFRRLDFEGCELVRSFIPPSLQIFGPDGYGDGHLLSNSSTHLRQPKRLLRKGFCGYLFDTFRHEPRRLTPRYPGDYISPLYAIYRASPPDLLNPVDHRPRRSSGGFPMWDLPGSSGYKRISIYTLSGV